MPDKQKKRGRPKLPKGSAKGVLIAVKVSPTESKEIYDAIDRSGISKPEWIRNSLISSARNVTK